MVMRPGSIVVTAGLAVLALVALALSIYALPTRLTVAVGPDDRDHTLLLTALANKLRNDRAPVRLQLVRQPDLAATAAAVDSGQTDLAVVRSDRMPRNAPTVAVLHESPVLFLALATSRVRKVADLAGRRIGVARGSPENLKLLDTVLTQASIDRTKVSVQALEPPAVPGALATQRIDVVMLVGPLDAMIERTLRAVEKTATARTVVFGVTEADAIALREPELQAMDIPRGALGGAPLTPADELKTLAITQRLVARSKLSNSVVNDLTRLIFTSRQALALEVPAAKAIQAPDTDAGAALPLHPGASSYLSGERSGFFDRYGDLVYVGSMLATMIASGIGALISFVVGRQRRSAGQFTHRLIDLIQRARTAPDEATLDAVQRAADELMTLAFSRVSAGVIDGEQFSTFAIVSDSVHMAIERRSQQLTRGVRVPAAGAA